MTLNANWSYPTAIRFGAGRITELADACNSLQIKKPLLVTDSGLASLPITEKALSILESGGFGREMFSEVYPNPDDISLEAGLKKYKEGNHDGVVVFGGGSAIDLGKMIAFMQGQTRPVWDYEDIDDWWTRANPDTIAPIIAVPTTSGTGSEVGRASVLTNSETHVKKIIFHPKILPSIVICDPELAVGMPPVITAGTGLDAFIHSFEAFCSPHYHPMSQGIALEGMRLVKDNLLKAYKDGTDIEARSHMMSAAAMGATAFQKGLGAVHALSHPVGAVYNTPHGMTNAIALPAVIQFNRSAIEDRIGLLASYLGIDGGFDGFYDWIVSYSEQLNVPKKLREIGVDTKQIDKLAQMAIEDPSVYGNPKKLTVEIAKQLYREII